MTTNAEANSLNTRGMEDTILVFQVRRRDDSVPRDIPYRNEFTASLLTIARASHAHRYGYTECSIFLIIVASKTGFSMEQIANIPCYGFDSLS